LQDSTCVWQCSALASTLAEHRAAGLDGMETG
jgi:hypothetical protein